MSGDALGFVHRYVPPAVSGELAGGTTLLLLHGTGGDEDLVVAALNDNDRAVRMAATRASIAASCPNTTALRSRSRLARLS